MNSKQKRLFRKYVREVAAETRLAEETAYIQHGATSCLLHSLAVAYFSWQMATMLHLHVSERSLIRGALLHDYFLYDWHFPDSHTGLHGYTHPMAAWRNAVRDVQRPLDAIEENIIQNHMFPLTLLHPPTCRESLLVCLVDKVCSVNETFGAAATYPHLRLLEAQLCEKP